MDGPIRAGLKYIAQSIDVANDRHIAREVLECPMHGFYCPRDCLRDLLENGKRRDTQIIHSKHNLQCKKNLKSSCQ